MCSSRLSFNNSSGRLPSVHDLPNNPNEWTPQWTETVLQLETIDLVSLHRQVGRGRVTYFIILCAIRRVVGTGMHAAGPLVQTPDRHL